MKTYFNTIVNLSILALGLFASTEIYAVNAPSIESEGQLLTITEAVIIENQSLTLLVPQEGDPENFRWVKNNTTLGYGFSLDVEDFSKSKSGVYTLIQYLPNGITNETNFNLNYLSLGEDLDSCGQQTLEFLLPVGPSYTWSTGSTSNNFTATFNESVIISVSAVTEFGHKVKTEKVIRIESDCIPQKVNSDNAQC